ncbi:AAA family ATPase [Leucobacter allii]|uniref:AAA family ATPase n=1 Tax=Leucobacter allii TaxID=2932247 RepID=A0ABY4FPV0_9MICO|nr:SbcC/MukB-like Walker B domain-containing protein [Leucobacter allii]UOQ58224.1 AAA family ATPase [Leucobacter allii]
MTMLDTLFGLIPAGSRGQQWLAEDLQLVNWGGYDGAHRVRFSPRATLLCGGSGSGKSTLMDAYIALMMPHTTPFNGASNGGVMGRARGEEQRNILSYARGKLDVSRSEEGTRTRVLRGDGADTWTAIAMTWVDHDGSRFSAVRAWYIPAGARALEETVRVRASADGPVELRDLEAAAARRFSDAALRAAGLEPVPTDREFSARLHAVLGIGAAGAGAKAMSLLARIQAGQQITTVDELYKRMVLEEPESLATADAVVAHFDELEGTRERMVTAQKQVRALRPIAGMRERIDAAIDRLRLLEELGRPADPGSLVALWRSDRRLARLRAAEAELQRRARRAEAEVREQQAAAAAAEADRDGLRELLRASGGDRIETAERELRGIARRLETVRAARGRLDELLAPLGLAAGTAAEFAALAEEAAAALATTGAKSAPREAYAEARAARTALAAELAAAETERREAGERSSNIPAALQQARERLADAAGLRADELPFVGELLEVRTEFEPWREACNLALGGFTTKLLVDRERLAGFRAAIDGVPAPVRLSYEGARAGLARPAAADPATLPGRLEVRDGAFAGWLEERLRDGFDFVCVDSAAELGRHPAALTITGQSSRGGSGAHGGQGRANALGTSNRRRLAALDAEIERLRERLAAAAETERLAAAALDELDARSAVYARIAELRWSELDVDAVLREQARWEAVIAGISDGDARVTELQRRLADAGRRAAALQEDVGRAKAVRERIAERWAALSDEVDAAQGAVDAAEHAGRALAPAQAAYLDDRFASGTDGTGPAPDAAPDAATYAAPDAAPDEELRCFDAVMETAAKRLLEDRRLAQETLEDQRAALARVFEGFLESWPNPNLRADPDTSFGDFARILAELETSGLHELEAEWRDSLLKLSGNDLTNLESTLRRALREIGDRIEPINRIMRALPFSDDAHRLQIATRETRSEARTRFRRELREVRARIEAAESDEDRAGAYDRMSRVIERIRRTAPDFADLVDVRGHVRVSAEKVRAETGEHVALYDHIGEKSGGESQELIAFIVGAALRYQLGDAGAERPRYAPVFLDEALIKADAHFTKRAIGAWRGLGFQLVIGAPNDKYSAIEPHVDVEYDILKDTAGRSWAKPKVALPG